MNGDACLGRYLRRGLAAVAVGMVLVLSIGGLAGAATVTRAFDVSIDNTQINRSSSWEQVWTISWTFPRVTLNAGDVLVLDVRFVKNKACQGLQVSDGGVFNDDESIYFKVFGSGGVGGGVCHTLPFTWEFKNPGGALMARRSIVSGNGVLLGLTGIGRTGTCTSDEHVDVDLTRTNFVFCGIKLTLQVPATIGAPWAPNQVTLSVDADGLWVVKCPTPKC